jgi:zinc transport system substrate-binding protein
MKRFFTLSFILLLTNVAHPQVKYVTTIHPFQEILKSIVGDRGEVHRILPPNASPHTYELRPSDIKMMKAATALFYGSENLDAWALRFENTNRIELLELVDPDFLIYFQSEHHDEANDVTHDKNHEIDHHHDASGVDPHFWTDPLTVKSLLPALTEKLCAVDPEGCDQYRNNSLRFSYQLDSLHIAIEQQLAPIHGSHVMISHPFFQYYFQRYGIELIGTVEKIPGREPTAKELKRLIDEVEQKNVKAIFDHVQLPDRAAKLIAETTGIKVVRLDPLGGVPGRESYRDMLLYNTEIIRGALR